MLPCVCSVIDHRWCQNVVRTKKWNTRRSRVCHWCSYHILTSSVICYWIRRTATWNLFHRSWYMNYFIYTSHHITPHGRYELNKMTSLPMCGFIAQLVEHRTGIAEVTGSNPVEALIFFRLLLSNCLNWKINCDDHSSLSCRQPQFIYELFHIYFTSD